MGYPKNGIVYSVEPFVQGIVPIVGRASASSRGRLLWHQYNERQDGSYAWDHFKTVGTGWNGLRQVFDGRGGTSADPKVRVW